MSLKTWYLNEVASKYRYSYNKISLLNFPEKNLYKKYNYSNQRLLTSAVLTWRWLTHSSIIQDKLLQVKVFQPNYSDVEVSKSNGTKEEQPSQRPILQQTHLRQKWIPLRWSNPQQDSIRPGYIKMRSIKPVIHDDPTYPKNLWLMHVLLRSTSQMQRSLRPATKRQNSSDNELFLNESLYKIVSSHTKLGDYQVSYSELQTFKSNYKKYRPPKPISSIRRLLFESF